MFKNKEKSKTIAVSKKIIDVHSYLEVAEETEDCDERISCCTRILETLDKHCLKALEMRAHGRLVKGMFTEALKDYNCVIALLDAMKFKYEKYSARFAQGSVESITYPSIRGCADSFISTFEGDTPKTFRTKAQIWHAKQLSTRGRLHYILEMTEEAITDFKRATTLLSKITQPPSEIIPIRLASQLGYAYTKAKQKKYAESIKYLDEEVLPPLKKSGQIEAFRQKAQALRQEIEALRLRGWLKLLLKEDNGAIIDFQDALEKRIAWNRAQHNAYKQWYDDNHHSLLFEEDIARANYYEAMVFAKSNPNADQRTVRFHTMECIHKWRELLECVVYLPIETETVTYRSQELKELDEVLASDPTCKLALGHRAELYDSLSKYDYAIIDYLKAGYKSYVTYLRSLDKVHTIAKKHESEMLKKYNAHDIPAAIEQADIVLLLDPKSANVFSIRGLCKAMLGNTKEGLMDCECAVNLDSKEGAYYSRRAQVQHKSGCLEAAITGYEKAIELGESVHSPTALANLKRELKKREGAPHHKTESSITKSRTSGKECFAQGEKYFQEKNYEKAQLYFKKAKKRNYPGADAKLKEIRALKPAKLSFAPPSLPPVPSYKKESGSGETSRWQKENNLFDDKGQGQVKVTTGEELRERETKAKLEEGSDGASQDRRAIGSDPSKFETVTTGKQTFWLSRNSGGMSNKELPTSLSLSPGSRDLSAPLDPAGSRTTGIPGDPTFFANNVKQVPPLSTEEQNYINKGVTELRAIQGIPKL